ncbi:RNA polymerase sigma factor [Sphingobacterium faecale]|uniref:Sigma-70 family RNA polymerase sigma factor n=1 Tax=Sphingobacterium faecale TaxID=2803775 RepID=A0ABS1R8Z4_9SPHI|nr:sigma-70 family RNA polymerase sigma factor [Sphingobacterium faecale]MBL1411182.1 sigma-70 family RNA polymerase sigma factor [Sphingobacterium faecale]
MNLDNAKLSELQLGNENGLRYFMKKHEKKLFFFAYKLTNNFSQAEEIVSDSFYKLWNTREQIPNISYVKSFLYLVTRNACYNHNNTSYGMTEIVPEEYFIPIEEKETDILAKIIYMELLDELLIEVNRLPKQQADIFRMSYIEDMDVTEICELLNTSKNTVYFSRSKALATLKEVFKKKNLKLYLYIAYLISLK